MSKYIYEMTDKEISILIEKNLPIREIEKKKYGEVLTPPILIDKMLDLFPKNCWGNPALKWLDPTCGKGFFMILIYQRLMEGLKHWESNRKKRSEHIIGSMIYMVELNPENCKICKKIFGEKASVICSDFLDSNLPFSLNSFDCIVGNPPFQDEIKANNLKNIGSKSKLYERIFLRAYDLLKINGYLSFITPSNIFSGNGVVAYKTLVNNNVTFVSLNSSINHFFLNIQQNFCYFILKKQETNVGFKTTIENNNGNTIHVKLIDRPVNPVSNWTNKTEKLIQKYISNTKNAAKYNRGKPIDSYKGNKYSIVYTHSKNLQTNNKELAVGLNIKKAIIFAISPNLEFKMDYSGKYGIGPNTFYIPFHNNTDGRKLEAFLKSKEYKEMALSTKTNRQFLKIGLIEHLNLSKIFGNNKTRKSRKVIKNKKTRKHNYTF